MFYDLLHAPVPDTVVYVLCNSVFAGRVARRRTVYDYDDYDYHPAEDDEDDDYHYDDYHYDPIDELRYSVIDLIRRKKNEAINRK